MSEQIIIKASETYEELDAHLKASQAGKIMLVCNASIAFLRLDTYFKTLKERMGIEVVRFSDFKPNPLYESVVAGVELFKAKGCDRIVAVGGGSAMDVAKCIKLYSNMDSSQNYLEQTIVPNDIALLAVPTTAGTGSEATRYAVIYYKGEKQSVSDYSCIPSVVLMDPTVLRTLPLYQKKSTMMDAFCHAVEAFWSVNSTEESKEYSREAIKLILANIDSYLANEYSGNENMLKAANIAGKAINITQTTAGHAMSYKLTSMYGIAHGHAAALCVEKLWLFMIENVDSCSDPRGVQYLQEIFAELADIMKCQSPKEGAEYFRKIMEELDFAIPSVHTADDYEVLKKSVNPVRLKNNPVELKEETIDTLYHQILAAE